MPGGSRAAASGSAPAREAWCVGPLSPQQCEWLLRPLIDAGLGIDRIRELLFRFCFDAIVSEGPVAQVSTLVGDQPAPVRAAWNEVVQRMTSLHRLDVG